MPNSRATGRRCARCRADRPLRDDEEAQGAGHPGGRGDDHRAAALCEPGAQRRRRLRRRLAAGQRGRRAGRRAGRRHARASRASTFTGKLPAAWPQDRQHGRRRALSVRLWPRIYASSSEPWTNAAREQRRDAAAMRASVFANGVPAASWSLVRCRRRPAASRRASPPCPPRHSDGARHGHRHRPQRAGRRAAASVLERRQGAAIQLGTFDPLDIGRETNGDVMVLVTAQGGQGAREGRERRHARRRRPAARVAGHASRRAASSCATASR